jgi:hypothetical protein
MKNIIPGVLGVKSDEKALGLIALQSAANLCLQVA